MKLSNPLPNLAAWCLLFTLGARAYSATLLDVGYALTSSDPTQIGRVKRDGVPSDWSAAKTFPGVLNTATSFHYHAFTVPAAGIGAGRFIQISVDDPSTAFFATAYDTAYAPNPLP